MAFDGTMVAALAAEIKETVLNDRIVKIAQPEPYEIILTIKGKCGQKRLLISANPSLPILYFLSENKPSPMNAPNFCMVLRKHLSNGRITDVYQPSLERIIIIEIEHLNELGDLCHKKLVLELMGKYSNIIFCDEEDMIIDSLKHISSNMSGLREVLPGRKYFLPEELVKADPFNVSYDEFMGIFKRPTSVAKSMTSLLAGMSMVMANELCFRAKLDSDAATASVSDDTREKLWSVFEEYRRTISESNFSPVAVYEHDEKTPVEFSALDLTCYSDLIVKNYESVSLLLETFYSEKNFSTNMKQKSADLRKVVSTLIDRNSKKLDMQLKQLKDTTKKDDWKIKGELILSSQYLIKPGDKEVVTTNYYTGEEVKLSLDPELTAVENANKLFAKYQKAKRTEEALNGQIEETRQTLEHLESIEVSIMTSKSEEDLAMVKEEMMEFGYIKRKGQKQKSAKSKPLHYISSDGFHMYVGKNNLQNDQLTFKFANGGDWWFHAKKMPGSHVIVKTEGKELPDATFNEAARLAAYYSKGASNKKVEIDYVQRKEVKKTPGGPYGFVIYHTNYSMIADSDITGIEELK